MVVAVLAATPSSKGLADILLNALNMALGANLANLLDVRPGRSGKFFLLAALPFATAGPYSQVMLVAIASVLAYLPWDLRGEAMMGDVGANVLGALLGLGVMGAPGSAKLAVLAFLACVHLYAEKGSLTVVIEQTPILRFLDALGRSDLVQR